MRSGYKNETNGEWVDTDQIVMLPSAVRTATASGEWFDVGDRHTARILLTNSVLAGTDETLDVTIETRKDASDSSPRTVGAFTQLLAAATVRKAFSGFDRQIRVTATLGGTGGPTHTTEITAELVG